MTTLEKEEQILRIRSQGIHPDLSEKLSQTLRTTVITAVKGVMEGALQEEVREFLAQVAGDKPQRSGFYSRGLNTQYGTIPDLQVPKLRRRNAEREWQIGRALSAESGQPDGLALLSLRDGPFLARSAIRIIFSIRSCPIGECRESDYSSSAAKIR